MYDKDIDFDKPVKPITEKKVDVNMSAKPIEQKLVVDDEIKPIEQKSKVKIKISKKGLAILGVILLLIIIIGFIVVINPLQYIDFSGINLGGQDQANNLNDQNQDLNVNNLNNSSFEICPRVNSELFLERIAVLSDGNNINSVVSTKNQNALNILILENKMVVEVISNDLYKDTSGMINLIKEKNVSNIILGTSQNYFTTELKNNGINCYLAIGPLNFIINSTETFKPDNDVSESYCSNFDKNFSEINGKSLLLLDNNTINSRISPRGSKAPLFFIYENNELLEIVENDFRDSNNSNLGLMNFLKEKNIETIFVLFSNGEFEEILQENEINCYKSFDMIKDLIK